MNRLWLAQIGAVARIELAKNIFSLRATPLYLLALLPVFVVGLMVVLGLLFGGDAHSGPFGMDLPGRDIVIYSTLYQFILRVIIYAGCVWIFMNLFRGEVLDRSLHYYFLSPIRREVLVIGKFISGWIGAVILFGISTLGSILVLQTYYGLPHAAGYMFGRGGAQALGYMGVTALACLGYGAVFLALGLFLKNPIVPALVIWVIEGANNFLPPLLKKISVIFYLQSLLPVAPDAGPFAFIAEPIPAFLAVPGLLIFTTAVLFIAGRKIRTMEIAYGND